MLQSFFIAFSFVLVITTGYNQTPFANAAFPDFRLSVHQNGVTTSTTKKALLAELNLVPLSLEEKRRIITAISKVMRKINPHRFLHLNFLKVDTVQSLRDLYHSPTLPTLNNVQFHAKIRFIMQQMNDRHTFYVRPNPLCESAAILGFFVRKFYHPPAANSTSPTEPSFAVSFSSSQLNFGDATFVKGVELLKWNGVDVLDVVTKLGKNDMASNPAAQLDRGTSLLTLRQLAADVIPSTDLVSIVFKTLTGETRTLVIPWIYFRQEGSCFGALSTSVHSSFLHKLNPLARNIMPHLLNDISRSATSTPIEIATPFQQLFGAAIISTSKGPVGRLIVPSFDSPVSPLLIAELSRVLRLMPANGLIMDLRSNAGGEPDYVKALSELISDKTFPATPTSLRSNALTEKLVFADLGNNTIPPPLQNFVDRFLAPLRPAMRTSREVGERFVCATGELPSSVVENRQLQIYKGPVITLIDGVTYSAGDLFTSVQQDINASLVVGVSENVGAGGASITLYSLLSALVPDSLKPLPGGVEFTTALNRFYRGGKNAGAIVEYFGVKPDVVYRPTIRDIREDDCDLFEFLASKFEEIRGAP